MDPRLRELVALAVLAALGCGLALSQGWTSQLHASPERQWHPTQSSLDAAFDSPAPPEKKRRPRQNQTLKC
jgi:alkylhydroperoxidase/carboxymuconolactone decarboxylase family protein YurZ